MTSQAKDTKDAALGCLLGACVGDAAGATLEMMGRAPTHDEVRRAMTMPGGGVWDVAPGQITDDGELTLCLARALAALAAVTAVAAVADSPTDASSFPLEAVAKMYRQWILSTPFDIGGTTSKSLGCVYNDPDESQPVAERMTAAAARHCMQSKANGSLMRISPLGIWGHRLADGELARCAQADSSLSHPNPACRDAVACYSIVVASLLRKPGDRQAAFEAAERWSTRHGCPEVQDWLGDARENAPCPYHPNIGFVRYGFTHAFRHLDLGTGYVDALSETLAGGGDTDTNACIVGGLIGAACGAAAIPEAMRAAVLQCDTTRGEHPRPDFLSTRHVPDLVDDLLKACQAEG